MMDVIFFDLDGTLLNKNSELSTYTIDTLHMLRDKNIAHTVATGRTMLSAQRVLGNHSFDLPHIYSNGVTVWDPRDNGLTLENLLNQNEVSYIVDYAQSIGITPFVNTVSSDSANHEHFVYHSPPKHQAEKDLINKYFAKSELIQRPLSSLSEDQAVTNISMIGDTQTIGEVDEYVSRYDSLVAYSGYAIEGDHLSWIDIHHRLANKGSAVQALSDQLGGSNIICFGDSYNDASMFKLAHESYAPQNAKDEIKKLASSVIGHHHEDGVAQFLRERFNL